MGGGALRISGSDSNRNQNTDPFIISQCLFLNNSNTNGGALMLKETPNVIILNNS